MGQSEQRYLAEKRLREVERCRQQGALDRESGVSSVANPFLERSALPSQSGDTEQNWFDRCDAWWRGWDMEDARRRERVPHVERSAEKAALYADLERREPRPGPALLHRH